MVSKVWLIKDPLREKRLFQQRAMFMAFMALLLLLIILGRMHYLQITRHDHYTTLSTNNRVTIQPLPPTRGLIFDRNATILAENLPTFSLDIIREQITDLEETLTQIKRLITISESDLKRFRKELHRQRRFKAVPLKFRLTDREVAIIAVNWHRMPGIEINSRLVRHYPYPVLTAHSVGYVGRINQNDLTKVDNSNYVATDYIGKLGVERSMESILHGKVGYQQVEVNARGRVLKILEKKPPVPGENIYLNIDLQLQRIATAAFADERGALVAIEPETGAVISLVSVPGFDSNLFVNGISSKAYRHLLKSKAKPLFNRALQGQYPPGSTTKPFIGLAGLHYLNINSKERVFCPGHYQLEGKEHRYRDWKKTGHGYTDLNKAVVESCDVFFYDLSNRLDIDRISTFMRSFGFGQKTGLDIGGERAGLMPSREWKRINRNESWYPGETLITGIGQGFSLATPLQLANITATFSTRGVHFDPKVINHTESEILDDINPTPTLSRPIDIAIREDHWGKIEKSLINVVHSSRGTARGINADIDYQIAGKTGTAQVFGIKQDEEYIAEDLAKRLQDHALFIAYAPADNPKIAVAVVVENGGSGSSVAAPIAGEVIKAYLGDNRRELVQ